MQISDDVVRVASIAVRQARNGSITPPENGTEYDECLARAALTAALAAMWRPIDTAPMNAAVLIKLPNLDYYGNNSVYAGMLVDMGTGKRWMTFGYAIGRDIGPDDWPLAWMPLPSPPSTNKEDGK
jgi:hypothetical protein